jgi:phospholipid/cholesterol/gamma-HCH transport system substrate-binding protein
VLTRQVRIQLVLFSVIAVVVSSIVALRYLDLPNLLFGIGHYRVTVELPTSGGVYRDANVTYRGTEVGSVDDVHLTPTGVAAVLSLESGVAIPADLDAEVHTQTAVGEQFIALIPRGEGEALQDGDVIPVDRTTVPPDINELLNATNEGLLAIPNDSLKTAIEEAYTAVGGLGPELARLVDGTTTLAADARAHLADLTTVIDQSKPILDTQIDTADAIGTWAANVADITHQLETEDASLEGVLAAGPAAVDETRQLLDRLRPTVPILAANLVSVGQVALTYQPNLEQILVLLPPLVEILQGSSLANRDTKQAYKGLFLSFNLNVNLPPPCTTGFLPANQVRAPSAVDYPDRPTGDMYCRVPQDSMFNVRGVRNTPCVTRPGKRAPTVEMCESDENYVPLNDGFNWKGDPNATLSGQPIPQPPPAPAPPPPPLAIADYDPATGTYIAPDGRQYTQTDLAGDGHEKSTWQDMLQPPAGS